MSVEQEAETTGTRHRLLVILAADAVGYSRLMATDDRATVASLDEALSSASYAPRPSRCSRRGACTFASACTSVT